MCYIDESVKSGLGLCLDLRDKSVLNLTTDPNKTMNCNNFPHRIFFKLYIVTTKKIAVLFRLDNSLILHLQVIYRPLVADQGSA